MPSRWFYHRPLDQRSRLYFSGHWECLWGYPVWFALAIIGHLYRRPFSFGLIALAWIAKGTILFAGRALSFSSLESPFLPVLLSVSMAQLDASENHQMHLPKMQAHFIALNHTPLSLGRIRASAGESALSRHGLFHRRCTCTHHASTYRTCVCRRNTKSLGKRWLGSTGNGRCSVSIRLVAA